MDHKPWKTLRRRLLLDRSPWLRVLADDVELPNGRRVEGYLRLEMRDHVVAVPLTTQGEVVLLRSYKRGPDAIDLQPPAGMIEPGEPPQAAAERELREETGYAASAWTHLGKFVLGGNLGAGWAHLFLAHGCRAIAEPASGDLEDQEIVLLPIEDARSQWRGGEFRQLGSVAALGLAFDRLTHSPADLSPP
jgi:ADP-ribose pyrophosphatase